MSTRHEPSVCQSCAMPMTTAQDHGTDVGGGPADDYCCHCFRDGRFTHPNLTVDEMAEHLVAMAPQLSMSATDARTIGQDVLPKLKRWRDSMP